LRDEDTLFPITIEKEVVCYLQNLVIVPCLWAKGKYQDEAGEIKSSYIVQASRFYPLQGKKA
jgi:hypothetical protein